MQAGRSKLICQYALPVPVPARYTTCEFSSPTLTATDWARCNDRLFPSTMLPRTNGDTSFHHKLARGCCGTLAGDHTHETSPINLHDEIFEPQVLLIDAGCEWQGYASDITRTIPIGNGGKFAPKAAEIYDLVLKMQKARQLR